MADRLHTPSARLSLSLKRKTKWLTSNHTIDETMPKRKRAGEVKMKTVDLTTTPKRKQTLITSFYDSPNKSEEINGNKLITPTKEPVEKNDVRHKKPLKSLKFESYLDDKKPLINNLSETVSTQEDIIIVHSSQSPECVEQKKEKISCEKYGCVNNTLNSSQNSVEIIEISDSFSFNETNETNVTDEVPLSDEFNKTLPKIKPEDKPANNFLKRPQQLLSDEVSITILNQSESSKIQRSSRVKTPNKNKSEAATPTKFTPEKSGKELESSVSTPLKKLELSTFFTPDKLVSKMKKTPSPRKVRSVSPQVKLNSIENVRFSPKIQRRPGKYFALESMPSELLKTPVKLASPIRKITPRKRNLMNDFEQSPNQKKLDNFFPSDVPSTSEHINYDTLLNDVIDENLWNSAVKLMDNREAMEKIRQESYSITQNELSILNSPQKSPKKTKKKQISNDPKVKSETFIDYLISNPMIKTALKKKILDHPEFCDMLNIFTDLSDACQLLYAKMFTRTLTWYRVDGDLVQKYNAEYGDVRGIVATLLTNGLITDDLNAVELSELLKLLKVNELKIICKHFNVNINDKNTMKKDNLVMALLNHACKQKTMFGNLSSKIQKRVAQELGQCVRLSESYRQFFNLLVVMATYPYYMDEEKKRLSDLILRLNNIKWRTVTYPAYILRPDVAFLNFSHLTDYAEALAFAAEYSNLCEIKDWTTASQKVIEAKTKFSTFLNNPSTKDLLHNLDGHLIKFTAGYQYAYCLSDGITVLKKDPNYTDDCIEVITILLSQHQYLQRRRGIWYDELALVLQNKKKDLVSACQAVIEGLQDKHVDFIRKKMLSQRGSALVTRKKSNVPGDVRDKLNSLILKEIFKPQCHYITSNSHEGVSGRKQVFYKEQDGEKIYSSVEEIVIDYYKNSAEETYANGLHDEGRTLMNLILGCFYDVIYSHPEGPSIFHCEMQSCPLDWGGRHFYNRRKQQIENVLNELKHSGIDGIMSKLENLCATSESVVSVVSWDYVKTEKLPRIRELLMCLGVEVFLKIAEHVIKDYRTYHSGFPDLILWNPSTMQCLIVEVKSPNDKLSPTQTVWLENLTKFGAKALVCHVENKGSRKRIVT